MALPQPEIMVGGAPRSEALWQIAPLAASFDDIENPVEQFAEGVLAGSSLLAGLRETIVDELPFGISQIRCVSHRECVTHCGTTYKLSLAYYFRHFQTGSKALNNHYLGYSVIRPTKPNCIGRTLLTPASRGPVSAFASLCFEK